MQRLSIQRPGRPFLLLASTGFILAYFQTAAGLVLLLVTLAGFGLKNIRWNSECILCRGKGSLYGRDSFTGLFFKNQRCYACNGEGYLRPTESPWYRIASLARTHQAEISDKLRRVKDLYRHHLQTFRMSPHSANHQMGAVHRNILSVFFRKSEDYRIQISHYRSIEVQAFVKLYEIQLLEIVKRTGGQLEALRDEEELELFNLETIQQEWTWTNELFSIDILESLLPALKDSRQGDPLKLELEWAIRNWKEDIKDRPLPGR